MRNGLKKKRTSSEISELVDRSEFRWTFRDACSPETHGRGRLVRVSSCSCPRFPASDARTESERFPCHHKPCVSSLGMDPHLHDCASSSRLDNTVIPISAYSIITACTVMTHSRAECMKGNRQTERKDREFPPPRYNVCFVPLGTPTSVLSSCL